MKIIKNRMKMIALLSVMTFPSIIIAQGGLTGKWKFSGSGVEMIMQINETNLLINGVTYPYKAENNNLLVQEGYSYTAYPYTLSGNQLTLEFPGGTKITFSREQGEPSASGKLPQSMQRPADAQPAAAQGRSLTGKWVFRSQAGELNLEFLSGSQLVFNGESTQYQLQTGIIQAKGDYGWIDYPYTFSDGKLIITFPDGTKLPFERKTAVQGQPAPNSQSQGGGGMVSLLKGSLCYWAGSSSSYSSYSRTEKIWFDGNGNFTYGREGSFSSEAGMAYSGDPNASQGTYRLDEKFVYLQFRTGETIKVEIALRANNGRITALRYDGKLYAAELCE